MNRAASEPAIHWVLVGWLAIAAGLLVFLFLYLNVPFPLWEFLHPVPSAPEELGQWRMFWFSAAIGAMVTLAITLLVVRRHRLRP